MSGQSCWTTTRFVRAFYNNRGYNQYEFGLYENAGWTYVLWGIYDCNSSGEGGGYTANSAGKSICPIVRIPATINITLSNGTNGAYNMHTIDGL